MKYIPILAILIGALSACESDNPGSTDMSANNDALANIPSDPEQERICVDEKKGEWKIFSTGVRMPHYSCEYTLPDGGEACTKDSDCEGVCVVDVETATASCQSQSPKFGCYTVLTEAGEPAQICVE